MWSQFGNVELTGSNATVIFGIFINGCNYNIMGCSHSSWIDVQCAVSINFNRLTVDCNINGSVVFNCNVEFRSVDIWIANSNVYGWIELDNTEFQGWNISEVFRVFRNACNYCVVTGRQLGSVYNYIAFTCQVIFVTVDCNGYISIVFHLDCEFITIDMCCVWSYCNVYWGVQFCYVEFLGIHTAEVFVVFIDCGNDNVMGCCHSGWIDVQCAVGIDFHRFTVYCHINGSIVFNSDVEQCAVDVWFTNSNVYAWSMFYYCEVNSWGIAVVIVIFRNCNNNCVVSSW